MFSLLDKINQVLGALQRILVFLFNVTLEFFSEISEVFGVLLITRQGVPFLLSHSHSSKFCENADEYGLINNNKINSLFNIQLFLKHKLPMSISHCRTRLFLAIVHSGLHWVALRLYGCRYSQCI